MINLTIIVPHYNSSRKLEKLLSSIPSRNDIQLIIVDDNSELYDLKYLMLLKKIFNFQLFMNYGKKGAGACRNIGINKAIGRWILFADSDDFFENDFYNKIAKFFDKNLDAVFFKATSIYLDTNKISDRHCTLTDKLDFYLKKKDLKSELDFRYKLAPAWSKLICKKFIDHNNIRFDEVIASNDVMFSIKVGFFIKNFLISQDVIYVVTRNHGSLTVTHNKEILEARVNVFIAQYSFLKRNITFSKLRLLGFSSLGFIFKVFIDYNFNVAFKVFLKMTLAGIPIFNKYHMNLFFLYKKIRLNISSSKRNKNYKINS